MAETIDAVRLSAQLNPKVIDGRVYVDLDALVATLFIACEASAEYAATTRDVALGLMTLGQTHAVQALDDVLGHLQAAHGLEVTGTPQGPQKGTESL